MKKLLMALLAVLTLTLTASALDLSLVGSGSTQIQGTKDSSFGTELRLEQYVTTNLSLGVSQGFSYASSANSTLRGSTELFTAYNLHYSIFNVKNEVYVGAGTRVSYGDGDLVFTAGPLLGNRLFIRENVYVLTQANYDIAINNAASNDNIRYTLGLGVRF